MKKTLRRNIAILLMVMLALSQFSIAFANEGSGDLTEYQSQEISKIVKTVESKNQQAYEDAIVPGKVLVKYKNVENDGTSSSAISTKSFTIQKSGRFETILLGNDEDVLKKVEELRKDPDVEYAEPVYRVKAYETSYDVNKNYDSSSIKSMSNPNDEYYDDGYQWGLEAIYMNEAWEKVSIDDREKITIAILDTGVDLDHEDLADSIVDGYDFVNNDTEADDDYGHGTHVAGIAAAISDNSVGIAGTAGGIQIMPVKVLDNNGDGDTSTIIEGIYWAVDNGADIINLSLGRDRYVYLEEYGIIDTYIQLEKDAIDYAVANGVVVIAATGNDSNHWTEEDGIRNLDGDDDTQSYEMPVGYPAALEGVIGVGAMDWYPETGFSVADFSNIGEEVDVMAPGVEILSTLPIELDIDFDQDGYTLANGTSMAAPFVTGLAALIKAANDELSVSEIEGILEGSTVDIIEPNGDIGKDNYYGFGMINGNYAFNLPRLNIDYSLGENSYNIDLTTEDYNGTVISDVYDEVELVCEKYTYDSEKGKWIWETEDSVTSVFEVVYGVGGTTFELPSEIGKYRLYVDETDDNNDVIRSRYKEEIVELTTPISNLSSGDYDSEQTVALTVYEPDTLIYYTLDGTDPSDLLDLYSWYDEPIFMNNSVESYHQSITISDSATLKAVAYKNGVFSDIATYSYNIDIASTDDGEDSEDSGDNGDDGGSSGGGGGSPGGGSTTPAPEEDETTIERERETVTIIDDEDGRKEAKVDVDEDKVKDILKDKDREVARIDATTGEDAQKVEVGMKADIISTANENNKPLVVEADNVSFRIEPGTINVDGDGEEVSLSSTQLNYEEMKEELPKTEEEADAVSLVYDFNLSVGDDKVTNFNKPMTITIDIDMSKVEDKDKVGVYYFNEEDNLWEYVGGEADEDGNITFTVDHFSTYTAMEYNKTFEDISDHWAKEAIEKMAARHIAKGITEDKFAPEESITRAEFAALIIRALDIEEASDSVDFEDIDEEAWYEEVVSKAYEAGIVSGTEDNKFAPNDTITREQMATMIMRAYQYASGTNLGEIITTMEIRFNDEGTASSWARRNIILANAKGFMGGFPDGSFRPQANATRAQAIVVIKKLLVELDVISE